MQCIDALVLINVVSCSKMAPTFQRFSSDVFAVLGRFKRFMKGVRSAVKRGRQDRSRSC